MRPELHLDVETRSEVDLRQVGLPNYADDPTTDLWCACWLYVNDRGEEQTGEWLRGQDPQPFIDLLDDPPILYAHNAGFEHALWTKVWAPKWGVPAPEDFSRWRCTAAMAAAMALPRALANAAQVLGLTVRKDAAGHRLMLQVCKPRSRYPTVWWDDPVKLRKLADYCHTDVAVEHQLAQVLRPLSEEERELWLLDHKINQRGIKVDLPHVQLAHVLAKAEAERLDGEMQLATAFALKTAKHPKAITRWLQLQGVSTEKTDKTALRVLLADEELSVGVRHVLRIREEARRSSLGKLEAFLQRTSPDGRLRDQLLYHGASTGRWAGTGVQLQNLMRPWMKHDDIMSAMGFLGGSPNLFRLIFGEPALNSIANMMRSFLIAEPGHELVMADFSNIEGRVLAWLAGEHWKLDAFRAYDAGTGPDLYVSAVVRTLGVKAEDVDDFLRQLGKVFELSLGFGGGHGALLKALVDRDVSLPELIAFTRKQVSEERWKNVADGWEKDNRYGLEVEPWTALQIIINGWRAAHPALCSTDPTSPGLWRRLEDAAMWAVQNKMEPVTVGPISFLGTPTILWARLPSGRKLAYTNPKIEWVDTPWKTRREAVVFKGQDQITRRWMTQAAYGGMWAENMTQAVARDLMAEAMLRVEAKGWPLVLTVHDEVVSEVPAGTVTSEAYSAVVEALPPWAEGLPVSAKAVVTTRYKK
jgi:DNA polymerase